MRQIMRQMTCFDLAMAIDTIRSEPDDVLIFDLACVLLTHFPYDEATGPLLTVIRSRLAWSTRTPALRSPGDGGWGSKRMFPLVQCLR